MLLLVWLPKTALQFLSAGAIFLRKKSKFRSIIQSHFKVSKYLCPIFQGFVPNFQRFCPNFRDFTRIFNKSKLLGVRLRPLLLHH